MTRLRRAGLAPERGPLAVAAEGPGGLRLVALDPEARALGLQPGEPLGRVRARIGVPLQVYPADPTADRDALLRLCRWAGGYAPLVAPFGPAEAGDGLYIDVAGASHLRGGEASLVDDLTDRLARGHIPARIALADTPGAAFALASHGGVDRIVVPPGGAAEALRGLPVEALRLDPGTVSGLKRLGLRRMGELDALPRGPLARRFGEALLLRLDQALARRPEPLAPLSEAAEYAAARGFLDPIGRQSDIVRTARDLMAEIAPSGAGRARCLCPAPRPAPGRRGGAGHRSRSVAPRALPRAGRGPGFPAPRPVGLRPRGRVRLRDRGARRDGDRRHAGPPDRSRGGRLRRWGRRPGRCPGAAPRAGVAAPGATGESPAGTG